jgi:hypothetical protein
VKVEVHEHEARRQCPFCRSGLGDEALHACATCSTAYHTECARESPRCAILGCGAELVPVTALSARPRTADEILAEREATWFRQNAFRACLLLVFAGLLVVQGSWKIAILWAILGCWNLAALFRKANR